MGYKLFVLILGAFSSSLILAATEKNQCLSLDSPWISLTSGKIELSVKSQPESITTSEPFSLIINVCMDKKAYLGNLKFDAEMPLHKHGMNYQASVLTQNNGQFLIQGGLLHMPGLWRFSFTLEAQNQPIFYNYVLP